MEKKSHILGVWELGRGSGHIARMHAIGLQVLEAGHDFTLVARDLAAVHRYTGGTQYPVLQAPCVPQGQHPGQQLASLADVFIMQGFTQTSILNGLQAGWRCLQDHCKPDGMIADYAPGVLLATQGSTIPKVITGNSFTMPVPGYPLSDWRPVAHEDGGVAEKEQQVLDAVNRHLLQTGRIPLRVLSDLYMAQAHIIGNFPLLDPWAELRKGASYHVSALAEVGSRLPIQRHHTSSLLCYLDRSYKQLEELLQGLAHVQKHTADVVLVCPGLLGEVIARLGLAGITASNDLIDFEYAMSQADRFLGHGGVGTLNQALRLGKPVFVLPMQMEQLNNGLRLQQAGLGKIIPEFSQAKEYARVLNTFMHNSEAEAQARKFSNNHQGTSDLSLAAAVVMRLDACI